MDGLRSHLDICGFFKVIMKQDQGMTCRAQLHTERHSERASLLLTSLKTPSGFIYEVNSLSLFNMFLMKLNLLY